MASSPTYGYTVQLEPNHVLAVRGMQRLSAAPRRKSPVTPAILRTLRDRLAFDKPHDLDGKVSEFTIQRRDVTFADGKGNATASKQATQSVTLRIRGSKTDRPASRVDEKDTAPVRKCVVVRGSSGLGIGTREQESKLSRRPTRKYVMGHSSKLAATRAGYDSKDFGTHTLRSGGATALYTGGSNDTTVKLHGRWKSECYQRYVHRPPPNWPRLCSTARGTLRNRRRLFKGVLQCMESANNSDSPLDVECGPHSRTKLYLN
ncbi:Integrase-like, catalytic domain [Phytophthora cactorum]|nr:Integrase-like, catalytic domain [Phytophthora cactorum]